MKQTNVKKPFNQMVWDACKSIPFGRVSTYKEIGNAIGSKGYRAIGNALNKNPHAPIVPCHRVVNSNGKIGGFAAGKEKKSQLLTKEGITIINGKISDFTEKKIGFVKK
jgi:methylated-DNA-[protein]-cysteine S-methyltransferase